MGEKTLVYDVEHYGTNFITDDIKDVLVELEEIARNLDAGGEYGESVEIVVRYMPTDEFDSLPEFDGF